MLTKTEIMRLIESGVAHELFAHEEEGQFDITLMRQAVASGLYGEPFRAPLSHELVSILKKTRDWDAARVKYIIRHQKYNEPGLSITCLNGEDMLCDGVHRIMARAKLRLKYFYFYKCPFHLAIRPGVMMVELPHIQWGRIELSGGVMYDRATGLPWKP